MKAGSVISLVAALAGLSQVSPAQSAQKVSVQMSAIREDGRGEAFNWVGDNNTNVAGGYGGEAQLRYNGGSAISWGAGLQFARHHWTDRLTCCGNFDAKLDMIGAFLEPRFVVPVSSTTFAPYLAARLALTRENMNYAGFTGHAIGQTINGGGGVLTRLSPRMNLDLGATYGWTHFGKFSTGGDKIPNGNGTNLITRVGLAFGLGH